MYFNPLTLLNTGGGWILPHIFVITLIAVNYMVPNTWTFPIYILFKFRNKEISGVPLSGLLEKVAIYFSKIDHQIFVLQNRFMLTK